VLRYNLIDTMDRNSGSGQRWLSKHSLAEDLESGRIAILLLCHHWYGEVITAVIPASKDRLGSGRN
jgi:hypothetical protein